MDVRLSELSEDTSVQLRFASELSEPSEQDPVEQRQPVRPQSARQRPIFTPRGTRITVAAHLWKQSERPSRPASARTGTPPSPMAADASTPAEDGDTAVLA